MMAILSASLVLSSLQAIETCRKTTLSQCKLPRELDVIVLLRSVKQRLEKQTAYPIGRALGPPVCFPV